MANLPVPNPRTAIAGEFETAAYMNAFRDAINFVTNPPMAQLYQSTAQSIPTATWTAVQYSATVADTYGGHSNTSNNTRYTAQVAGWYLPSGAVAFTGNSTGARGAEFYKNGANANLNIAWELVSTIPASYGGASGGTPSPLVFLNVGDYIELYAFQDSGGALNTNVSNSFQSWMSVLWVHA